MWAGGAGGLEGVHKWPSSTVRESFSDTTFLGYRTKKGEHLKNKVGLKKVDKKRPHVNKQIHIFLMSKQHHSERQCPRIVSIMCVLPPTFEKTLDGA